MINDCVQKSSVITAGRGWNISPYSVRNGCTTCLYTALLSRYHETMHESDHTVEYVSVYATSVPTKYAHSCSPQILGTSGRLNIAKYGAKWDCSPRVLSYMYAKVRPTMPSNFAKARTCLRRSCVQVRILKM